MSCNSCNVAEEEAVLTICVKAVGTTEDIETSFSSSATKLPPEILHCIILKISDILRIVYLAPVATDVSFIIQNIVHEV